MPNIITHTLFCEKAYALITNQKYKDKINEHKKEYIIGTNGPDFLFFHDLFPLYKKMDPKVSNVGTTFHRKHINAFYECALQVYLAKEEGPLKDAMASYLIAHYLHWQLDSVMHPYVVYRTGFKDPMSKYYHHRFESMMDAMLLQHFHKESIRTFKTYALCNTSKDSVEAISAFYIPCTQVCQDVAITKKEIAEALADWQKAQRYLYDPSGYKRKGIKIVEAILHKPWLYSGNVVPAKIDARYDVLNTNKKAWLHPCTGTPSFQSVLELFEEALEGAKKGLPLLFDAMDDKGMEAFLSYLDDKTYSNGVNGSQKRRFKDVIYES